MTTKAQPDLADINALAIEACDMWQEHLSAFAQDPNARAELTRFLEPQRRLFADWATLMQKGATHEPTVQKTAPTAEPKPTPAAPPPGDAAHGDNPLRVAQLALRVAELEKRLAQLERQLEPATDAARRTQRHPS